MKEGLPDLGFMTVTRYKCYIIALYAILLLFSSCPEFCSPDWYPLSDLGGGGEEENRLVFATLKDSFLDFVDRSK